MYAKRRSEKQRLGCLILIAVVLFEDGDMYVMKTKRIQQGPILVVTLDFGLDRKRLVVLHRLTGERTVFVTKEGPSQFQGTNNKRLRPTTWTRLD